VFPPFVGHSIVRCMMLWPRNTRSFPYFAKKARELNPDFQQSKQGCSRSCMLHAAPLPLRLCLCLCIALLHLAARRPRGRTFG
jgi:hypothetical protein